MRMASLNFSGYSDLLHRSSTDNLVPALPPKRDKRPVKSSSTIISNRTRNNDNTNSLLISSSSPNKPKHDKDNDDRIQLIVDDINQIVEQYTRELDDALFSKTKSNDHLTEKNSSSIVSISPYHQNSIDTLYETNVSKITKSTVTKTTVDNGQGMIDKKELSEIFNETDCVIQSPKGDFKTQKLTIVRRQKTNDDQELPPEIIVNSRINHINLADHENTINDPPPLPPKRKTGL